MLTKGVNEIIARAGREHGWLLAITVLSVLASLIQLFIDVSATISVKWLLFAILVAAWVMAILLQALAMTIGEGPGATEIPVVGFAEGGEVLVV